MSWYHVNVPPAERQAEVLRLLGEQPRMGKELAGDMGISEQQVSMVIMDLQRAGLVRKGFSLTEEGRRRVRRIR